MHAAGRCTGYLCAQLVGPPSTLYTQAEPCCPVSEGASKGALLWTSALRAVSSCNLPKPQCPGPSSTPPTAPTCRQLQHDYSCLHWLVADARRGAGLATRTCGCSMLPASCSPPDSPICCSLRRALCRAGGVLGRPKRCPFRAELACKAVHMEPFRLLAVGPPAALHFQWSPHRDI